MKLKLNDTVKIVRADNDTGVIYIKKTKIITGIVSKIYDSGLIRVNLPTNESGTELYINARLEEK